MTGNGVRRPVRAIGLAVLLVGLAGCASVPADGGFGKVQGLVAERLDQEVQWRRGTAEDAAAAEAVTRLLEDGLTVDEAVQVALLNNRTLQATYGALGLAQADLVQAGLLANPVFTGTGTFGPGPTRAALDVVQDFLSVVTRAARQRLASANVERVTFEIAHRVVDLAADVRAAYYGLVADTQALDLFRHVVTSTEAAAELAERQVQAGNLSRNEQAVQQALYAQTLLELAETETRLTADRERLNRLLGLWGAQTDWTLPATTLEAVAAPVPPEDLEALAIRQRLDLAAARKHVEAVKQALVLTRRYRLLGHLGIGFAVEREAGQWFKGPSIELGLPLFDRGQGRVAALEAQARQSRDAMTALATNIRSRVRETWTELAAARAAVQYYREVLLPLHQTIVAETQKLYNANLVGVYTLLLAKQNQITVARDYVAGLRRYWLARSELERVLGGRLPAATPAPESSKEGD